MKNIFVVVLLAHICAAAYSQTLNAGSDSSPVISLKETTHDFGTVIETDGTVSYSFEVTNTGTADLIITNVQGSCGCAVPEWSKTPIAPGGKGYVKVTFNPLNRPGAFNKSVVVTNNSAQSPVTLFIKGNVVKASAETTK